MDAKELEQLQAEIRAAAAPLQLLRMERLRRAIPNVQFTTDVIVGFPQETEAEFAETLDFVRRARFLMVHVFPYSRRKGTEADRMTGQLPETVKHERVRILSAEQAAVRRAILNDMTGRETEVLFETDAEGIAYGHTPDFVEIRCPTDTPLHGRILPVRIEGNDGTLCTARLL